MSLQLAACSLQQVELCGNFPMGCGAGNKTNATLLDVADLLKNADGLLVYLGGGKFGGLPTASAQLYLEE